MLEKIRPENLMVFGSEAAARAQGFAPSQYAFREAKKR
jgi:hypothetical protein